MGTDVGGPEPVDVDLGYAGSIHVGFKVDTSAVPDPHALVAGLQAELAELVALAPHR